MRNFLKKLLLGGIMTGQILVPVLIGLVISQAITPQTADAALIDNIVSYWKTDESSGSAADSAGANTLTNNNTTAYAAAKINNGADIELGSSNSLSITDGSQSGLDLAGDFTITAWVKPESDAEDTQTVVSKWNSGDNNRSFHLYYSGTNWIFAVGNGSSSEFLSIAQTYTPGTFYFVTAQFTSSTKKYEIFINGSSIGSANGSTVSVPFNGSATYRIGAFQNTATGFFDGLIDEVGIWSRILSGAEITSLYNAGAGNQYPFGAASDTSPFILFFE